MQSRIDKLCWLGVVLGLCARVWTVLSCRPEWSLSSDSLRHFNHALHYDQAVLTLLTPLFWGLWLRHCMPSRRTALVALLVLTWWPSWVGIFCYVLPETLLLPLLGLALWLSWEAVERNRPSLFVGAGLAWGYLLITKLSVVPCLIIVWIWMLRRRGKQRVGLLALVALLVFAYQPVHEHSITGAWEIVPGWVQAVSVYYASDAYEMDVASQFRNSEGGLIQEVGVVISPDLMPQANPYQPFATWHSSRSGKFTQNVTARGGRFRWGPSPRPSLQTRIQLMGENFILFFLSPSWPEDMMNTHFDAAQMACRWLILPLSWFVGLSALTRRRMTILSALCLLWMAFFLLQQSAMIEGRYRKPWEGLLLVALVECVYLEKQRQTLSLSS
jgi:hypothetical protein